MFHLFRKKKDETPPAASPSGSDELRVDDEAIQVMPKAYGTLSTSLKPHEAPPPVVPAAQQPTTYNLQSTTSTTTPTVTPPTPSYPKRGDVGSPSTGSGNKFPPSVTQGGDKEGGKSLDRRILWALGGVVLVLVIIVTALLLWPREAPEPTPIAPTPPIVVIPPPPTPPEPVIPPPQPLAEAWVFPVSVSSSPLAIGNDQDKDNLTDSEEALFKTNQALGDSDGDSYSDGLEVVNVYSPRRGRRARISATAEVSTFTWSPGKAKFIYPAGLRVETKDELVVITTATGESFSLRLFSLEPFTNLSEWITAKAPIATGAWTQENYRGQASWWSPDNAAALLSSGGQVYLWHYETGGKPVANFFSTFKLLVRSTQFIK